MRGRMGNAKAQTHLRHALIREAVKQGFYLFQPVKIFPHFFRRQVHPAMVIVAKTGFGRKFTGQKPKKQGNAHDDPNAVFLSFGEEFFFCLPFQ